MTHTSIPSLMTTILWFLALGTMLSGSLGIPHQMAPHWLRSWLVEWATVPVVGLSTATPHNDWDMMILAIGWSAICALITFVFYVRNIHFACALKKKLGWAYKWVASQFGMDSLYNTLLLVPVRKFSEMFLDKLVEQRLIDGFLVNGTAQLSRFFAWSCSLLQTGLLGHYVLYLLLGLVLVVWMLV